MKVSFILAHHIIVPPERQRTEFDAEAMAELSNSISTIGLLHPLILRSDPISETYTLLTGERRLRAITNLYMMSCDLSFNGEPIPQGTVPAFTISLEDDLTAMEIEYDENTKRENLTWQEQAKATARLAEFRRAKAAATGSPPPTISDLSTEVRGSGVGSHASETRRELIVAQHLHRPEVAKAKNVTEAFKFLKREEVANANAQRAVEVGQTFSADLHNAYQGNAKEWMPLQPAETYDLILTDPPYGMGADTFGDSGTARETAHSYSDAWEDVYPTIQVILKEGYRLCKPKAHLYMFCDIDHFHEIREYAKSCGWWVFRTPLIWHKISALRAPWPGHGPRRHYETILYAVKGKKPVTALYADVITTQVVGGDSEYQAQKPVPLYTNLIQRSCTAGARILDPCMGSGTIFPAAHEMKCAADGVELLDEPFGIAIKRLGELK